MIHRSCDHNITEFYIINVIKTCINYIIKLFIKTKDIKKDSLYKKIIFLKQNLEIEDFII